MIPTLPAMSVPARNTERVQRLRKRFARRMEAENRKVLDWRFRGTGDSRRALFSIVSPDQLCESPRPCLMRMRSCRRTGCVPYRNVTQRLIRCPACQVQPSNMSPQNLIPQCMAATPTGADQSGSRSIIWSFERCCSTTNSLGRSSPSSIQPDRASGCRCVTSPVILPIG